MPLSSSENIKFSFTNAESTNTNKGFSFPGFGNTSSTGFQFATTATTTANTSSTFSFQSTAAASANKPLFSNTPKFSFSDIAKQTSSNDKPTSNVTEQRGMNVNLNFFILFICFLMKMIRFNQLYNYQLLKLKQVKKMKMFSFVNVENFTDWIQQQIK